MGKKKTKKVKEDTIVENTENLEVTNNEEMVVTSVDVIGDMVTAGLSQVIEDDTESQDNVEPEVVKVETKGIVSECNKLFVRSKAKRDCDPAGVINLNDEVTIDLDNSTDDYYKVITANGIEGYCLKTFIKLK